MDSEERLLPPEDARWHNLVEGIDFRLLFASAETGRWTVLLRCQPGSAFKRHRHLGAGEYFVVKGRMEYRMGAATEGTYGYEPLEAIHDHTSFPEYTELYFTNYGAVVFLGEKDEVIAVLNHRTLLDIVEATA